MTSLATLYYVHDPMCAWCWGYKPALTQLKKELESLPVKFAMLVGGLAPDSDEPMPQDMQEKLQNIWRNIHQQLGTPFNYDFWRVCQPRRSTYPACRAVLAAKEQNKETAMIEAIQEAYYLRAMSPSDNSTLVTLAEELGLDVDAFSHALKHSANDALIEQITLARSMPISGFPSLVLAYKGRYAPVLLDYKDPAKTIAHIQQLLT